MQKKNIMKHISIFLPVAAIIAMLCSCTGTSDNGRINVLIFSGKNNHEWNKTTPILIKMYKESGLFDVSMTNIPDTMKYHDMKQFDVIVSNRNTWPDNEIRLSPEWEADFLRYMKEGGAAVFIHAGASSYYGWNDYHKIGTGRWGKETSHGTPQKGKVFELSQDHPVTTGLRDFYITDELWKKTDIHPDAKAIASVSWTGEESGEQFTEKAVFANSYGKGRSFYTILGHDERALLNSGLKTILIRGTLWAAGKENMPEPIEELNTTSGAENDFSWEKTDSSFCLKNGKYPVWQFNFNNRYGRPYFHPVSASESILTCVDPPDHPWHLGLWFCWKYINEINYWEYLDEFKTEETGYKSEGITDIKDIRLTNNADFTAAIDMDISYYPIEGEPVLSEKSLINISAPAGDGSFYIDYDNLYTAVANEVILDRTPVQTEPGGRTWGGYAGLSARFSQDFTDPFVLAPNDSADYKKNNWVYMGFTTLSGGTAGVSIIQDPEFTTTNTSWYIIRTPAIPFFYYSPAVLYDGKITLKKGDQLHLKYRVWIIPGKTNKEELEKKYDEYLNGI